jgi:hypothetical protein
MLDLFVEIYSAVVMLTMLTMLVQVTAQAKERWWRWHRHSKFLHGQE